MSSISITENRVLMSGARKSLKGKWGLAIGATVVYFLVVAGAGEIPKAGGIISLLIGGPMSVGMAIFSLSLSRRQDTRLSQIFEGFSRFGVALGAYLLYIIFVFLWSLLLIVPGIIASLAYSQIFYIIAEDDSIGPLQAIKKSKEMMLGNKWKLFCLFFRFIGWALLCVLTFGIGFLWLCPYVTVSLAQFYDDVKGQATGEDAVFESGGTKAEEGINQLFFPTSKTKLIVLSVCTFGIYQFYWFYKNWQILKINQGLEILPFWRTFFTPVFCYSLFKSVRDCAGENGVEVKYNQGTLTAVYIFLSLMLFIPNIPPYISIPATVLAVLVLIPVQDAVNLLNVKVIPDVKINKQFGGGNITSVVIGVLFWALIIFAMSSPIKPEHYQAITFKAMKLFGLGSPETALMLDSMEEFYRKAGNEKDAERLESQVRQLQSLLTQGKIASPEISPPGAVPVEGKGIDEQYTEGLNHYRQGHYKEAMEAYRKCAANGHTSAQYQVGVLYSNGQGVERDYKEAVNWYRRAAARGHAEAQNSLCFVYSKGQGVEQDYKEAVKWCRKAAESGHVQAQYNLGTMYFKGLGTVQDFIEAANWYREAADQGYAQAQTILGLMYSRGQGKEQNYKKAVKWYRKAAEQGYAQAQFNLGVMYTEGQGVEEDYEEAETWYRKAAEQGHVQALEILRVMSGESRRPGHEQFIGKYVAAINAGEIEALKRLIHPGCLACINDENRDYYDDYFSREFKDHIPDNYKMLDMKPIGGDEPLMMPDMLYYPVRPAYWVQIDFETKPNSSKSILRQVVKSGDTWFMVLPCPKPEAVKRFKEVKIAKEKQKERARLLLQELKDPLLSELTGLLKEGMKIEAWKKYSAETGEDISMAKEVLSYIEIEREP